MNPNARMKNLLLAASAALAIASIGTAQTTTTTSFAPTNFGDMLFTSTPSNATGSSGVTTVFGSNGTSSTLGTGGSLVNSSQFNYSVTGPNTAVISSPASGSTPASTTTLTFTSANAGTFSTVSGNTTSTGSFRLASLPNAAPIANVSVRSTLFSGGSTTVGFVVGGSMPRKVLLRAIGPGLATFGVKNGVADPELTLFKGSQALAINDNWGTAATLS